MTALSPPGRRNVALTATIPATATTNVLQPCNALDWSGMRAFGEIIQEKFQVLESFLFHAESMSPQTSGTALVLKWSLCRNASYLSQNG